MHHSPLWYHVMQHSTRWCSTTKCGAAHPSVRDWSLITERGATKREGGHVKFYPCEKKGGGGKKFQPC